MSELIEKAGKMVVIVGMDRSSDPTKTSQLE